MTNTHTHMDTNALTNKALEAPSRCRSLLLSFPLSLKTILLVFVALIELCEADVIIVEQSST